MPKPTVRYLPAAFFHREIFQVERIFHASRRDPRVLGGFRPLPVEISFVSVSTRCSTFVLRPPLHLVSVAGIGSNRDGRKIRSRPACCSFIFMPSMFLPIRLRIKEPAGIPNSGIHAGSSGYLFAVRLLGYLGDACTLAHIDTDCKHFLAIPRYLF